MWRDVERVDLDRHHGYHVAESESSTDGGRVWAHVDLAERIRVQRTAVCAPASRGPPRRRRRSPQTAGATR